MSSDQFAADVLRRIGAQPTGQNMRAMRAWIKQEGGHTNGARYNWLNTTQPAPGAGNTGTQGNIKVYRTAQQGVEATAKTLKNGNYGNILAALKQGDSAERVARAIEQSPWGTKHINTLGSVSAKPAPAGAQKDSTAAIEPGTMKFEGQYVPASTRPSLSVAAEMVLARGGNMNLPKLGSKGKLAQTVSLYRSGLATEPVPASYQSKTTTTPSKVLQIAAAKSPSSAGSGNTPSGNGKFKISGPNPKRLQPELVSFARKVAAQLGAELEGMDGSTHSKFTVNGNVSEHFTGNATDIFKIGGQPAKGTVLLHAGQAALIAAGMPREQALKSKGGLYNVGNHQIIFLTMQGGNHFDHLHISTHAKSR